MSINRIRNATVINEFPIPSGTYASGSGFSVSTPSAIENSNMIISVRLRGPGGATIPGFGLIVTATGSFTMQNLSSGSVTIAANSTALVAYLT